MAETIRRTRRPITIPDPVPTDPLANLRGVLEDMGHAGVNDPRRIGGVLDNYEITVGDLVAITGGDDGGE